MKAFDYQPKYKKTVLSNGVRIITEHHPYTRSTSVGFYVDLGSRDEPSHLIGAAHFLEHILFKGTRNRSAYEIVSALESVGGEINAYTAKEYTCYHATTLREHKSISLDVLSDLLLNSICSDSDFDRERNVIFQEIDMSKDVLEEYIFENYFEKAYHNHPLSQPILGTQETLSKISKEDLFNFYQSRYHGPHLIVAVAGDVDHESVVEQLRVLEDLKRPIENPPERKKPQAVSFFNAQDRPSEQLHLLLGLPSSDFRSNLRFESYIVNAALGGATTSRLYQSIREAKGLAYNVYSSLHAFTDTAMILTYIGTSLDQAEECLSLVKHEFDSFKRKSLTEEEIEYYKTQVMGQILLGADDVDNRMNSIAINEMVFGTYKPVDEVVKEIESVNVETIRQYTDIYMTSQPGFLAMGNEAEKTESIYKSLFS